MDLSKFRGVIKTVRPLDMAAFDVAYAGAVFQVWVTPSRAHLDEWRDLTLFINDVQARMAEMEDEEKAGALAEYEERKALWYATTWGMAVEEVREMRDALQEGNPLAWDWLCTRTSQMIGQYRQGKLKN